MPKPTSAAPWVRATDRLKKPLAAEAERAALRQALYLSIGGIAAAMQRTG